MSVFVIYIHPTFIPESYAFRLTYGIQRQLFAEALEIFAWKERI
jgi:hypothetical protein